MFILVLSMERPSESGMESGGVGFRIQQLGRKICHSGFHAEGDACDSPRVPKDQ